MGYQQTKLEHNMERVTKWRAAAKRELIAPRGDERYIRRGAKGKESDDESRSLSQDRRKKAKTEVKAGQGDRGDRRARPRKKTSARK